MSGSVEALREERLSARIGELTELIEFMEADPENAATRAIQCGRATLEKAVEAQGARNWQVAWRHCHQAYRFLLWAMSDEERESRRKALRREAETKLQNWRRDAVLDILGRDADGGAITAGQLTTAQFVMDEHVDNMYFKLEAAAAGLRPVPWVMGLLTLALVALAAWLDASEASSAICPPHSVLVWCDLPTTVVVLIAGAVGAMLSNTLTVVGHSGRIPAFLGQLRNWFVRLPLGALSAFVVVAVVQSGLLPLEGENVRAVYAWAFVAGFSDQLLNRVMRRVESSAAK